MQNCNHHQPSQRKAHHPLYSFHAVTIGIVALFFIAAGYSSIMHQPELPVFDHAADPEYSFFSRIHYIDYVTPFNESLGILRIFNTVTAMIILLLMYQNTIGRLARERQQNKNLQNKKRRNRTRRKLRLAKLNQEEHPS